MYSLKKASLITFVHYWYTAKVLREEKSTEKDV